MKNFGLIVFVFTSLSASAQSHYGTKNEKVIRITEDSTYLQGNNIGLCDLPEVTRGDGDSLVRHHILVEMLWDNVNQTSLMFSLKSENQFDYDLCNIHKNKLNAAIRNDQYGVLPIKVRFTEKMITYKGSYMGMLFCQQEHVKLIETDVINIHYSNTIKISERPCL